MADPRDISDAGAPHPIRRAVLKTLATLGIAAPVFGRALSALAEEGGTPAVTPEMIRRAEWVSGLSLTDEQRELMRNGVNGLTESFARLRGVSLDNGVAPAIVLDPLVPDPSASAEDAGRREAATPRAPAGADPPGSPDDLAFASVVDLAGWVRSGKLAPNDLAELSLARLERYGPALECVIERTPGRAAEDVRHAGELRDAGDGGSGLVGVPWGAKDLLSVPGTRTTWGAKPYENQRRDEHAAVAERLRAAGAVLTAKLTVGALAWGDVWYGGTTRNPWNPEQGSSGSSAGPAAATAAGLVPFAIGTETWGSIVSPSTRCGVTGLRPTFGRVSRRGCMALSWTMDKIGPMARSAEDCAWIFAAIAGADPGDRTTRDVPFSVPGVERARSVRVGVVRDLFDHDWTADIEDEAERARGREWRAHDARTLEELEGTGLRLDEVRLPGGLPVDDLAFVLTAEAATAFDDLTRSGRDAELVRQVEHAWPNVFRQGQLIPAVEYLRANRIRRLLMEEMERFFESVDVFVAPTFGGSHLLLTNLTGHPSITMPNGFRASDGTPTSITFTGRLDGEEDLLAVAMAWQDATDHHRRRPPLP